MATVILNKDRLEKLQAMQGTRGILSEMAARAALLTPPSEPGFAAIDVLAENPSLRDALNRNGEIKYADDNGNFSLNKLYNDVKANVQRRADKAKLDNHSFPNVEALIDTDADTVFIVNFDAVNDGSEDDGDDS